MERSQLTLDVHPADSPPPYDSVMRTSSLSTVTASAPEAASAPYPDTPTSNPPYPVTPVLNRPPYPVTPDSGQPPYPIPGMHDPLEPGSRSSAQHSIRVPFPKPEPILMSMPQPMSVRMPMPESPSPSPSSTRNPNPLPHRHTEAGTSVIRQTTLDQALDWNFSERERIDRRRKKQLKGLYIGIGFLIPVVIFLVIFGNLHHRRNP